MKIKRVAREAPPSTRGKQIDKRSLPPLGCITKKGDSDYEESPFEEVWQSDGLEKGG
jgi:hypothetical protein